MSTRRLAKVPLFGNAAKAVTVEAGATVGAQIGVNLLMPDGSLATTAKLQALFGDGTPSDGSINTTDDLEEGAWNLWFTDRRAQDAVGGILADTATIDLAYTAGTSITATLKDLTDSGTGATLVKITRDAKGRISGTSAATTTDLAEGTNLYYTDARADARITLQKAQPLGLATLDAGGKLDAGQLPALAITETFVVNTEAAMLALSAQEGDVAVRTDLSKSFILTAAPASTLANWQELLVPTAGVTSFNGRTGSVTPASGDYTPAQVGAEPAIAAGTTAQYRRGDKTWRDFATDVRAAVLTGLSTATSTVITATDTVLGALGKLQAQINGKAPSTQSGTYASRPAASAAAGVIYYATDVQEAYRSDGSTWTVLPCGGTEIGYAEITNTTTTTSATAVDIAGLSVTCKVGERPVVLSYGGAVRNSLTGAFVRIQAVADGFNTSNITVPGTGNYLTQTRETRVSGLTPGSTYTFKLQILAIGGGTAYLYGDANDRPYLQVRTT